jgi:hypothetical protein
MSSARARTTQILGRAARAVRAVVWTVVLGVLAASGAGLVGQAWHAPGSPARAELTYTGDTALEVRLDDATQQLTVIAAEVEKLAADAKAALAEVTSSDPTRLRDSLKRGEDAATTIDIAAHALRGSLADLPGDEPAAPMSYSNDALVRRSTIVTAIDAAAGLAALWQQVAARSTEAANLTGLIATHDQTVLDAAAKGRKRAYSEATAILGDALLTVVQVQELRVRLIAGSGETVLDEWIQRNAEYDRALRAVYQALVDSGGRTTTLKVQRALRAERIAFEQLPPDRRTIIVIVSEVTRGGLTDAVVAIEDAHGRIDEALAEAP